MTSSQRGQCEVQVIHVGPDDVDRVIALLSPGSLNVIAGTPGVGKTTLSLRVVRAVAGNDKPVLLFSPAQGCDEIERRLQALGERDNERGDAPIMIVDSATLTIGDLRTTSLGASEANGGLGLIVVNYVQLIHCQGTGHPWQEMEGLKAIATETHTPLLALCETSSTRTTRGVFARMTLKALGVDTVALVRPYTVDSADLTGGAAVAMDVVSDNVADKSDTVLHAVLTEKQLSRTTRTEDGHLLWQGALANGYPAIKREGRTVYLRRLIWEKIHGSIVDGCVVGSRCGELPCIEPSHLKLSKSGRPAGARAGRGKYAPNSPG